MSGPALSPRPGPRHRGRQRLHPACWQLAGVIAFRVIAFGVIAFGVIAFGTVLGLVGPGLPAGAAPPPAPLTTEATGCDPHLPARWHGAP